jgi:hypothetical protein
MFCEIEFIKLLALNAFEQFYDAMTVPLGIVWFEEIGGNGIKINLLGKIRLCNGFKKTQIHSGDWIP